MEQYGLHSEFDAEKHKQTFIHYLEVMIDRDGEVSYAVPSHQEKMIKCACECLGLTRQQLYDLCPREYYCEFMGWLSMLTGLMAVWEGHYEVYEPTKKQIAALRRLKLAGLYTGFIPQG
jgi:hypothetical protein